MNPTKLDHVAYWVADRDPIADFVTARLGMHVIDRTERFTLLGSNARRGKLTLFDADGPRERGALKHVALRVSALEAALAELPAGLDLERPREGEAYFDVGAEGVRLGLVEAQTDVDYDLDHVALLSHSPAETAGEYASLGFASTAPGASGAPRVEVVHWFLERPEDWVGAAYAASDRGELEERLAARIQRARARMFAVSEHPHRGLCETCPGRAGLCSWSDGETMRELPGDEASGSRPRGEGLPEV